MIVVRNENGTFDVIDEVTLADVCCGFASEEAAWAWIDQQD